MAERTERVYSAMDIAKYVISKCMADNCPISNLQLQKILYFLQKNNLVKYHIPLFEDEIQAWQFGPVVPEVYYRYCGFGSMAITMDYSVAVEEKDRAEIDSIIEDKRSKKPWELVEETHAPGKAWNEVYCDGSGNHRTIPNTLIETRG